MFELAYSVKMFDTDASGYLFFTSQMRMAHEAYERFMESANLGISHILRASDFLLPIVHAETDYAGPSSVGDSLAIQVTAERVGKTSFTLFYRFLNEDKELVGTARTVHVAIDRDAHAKRELPDELRQAVTRLLPSG